MDNKLVLSVLAAAAIYIALAAIFGVGLKTIATEVPAGQTDPQFAPVVCRMAVACPYPGQLQSTDSIDSSSLRTVAETK